MDNSADGAWYVQSVWDKWRTVELTFAGSGWNDYTLTTSIELYGESTWTLKDGFSNEVSSGAWDFDVTAWDPRGIKSLALKTEATAEAETTEAEKHVSTGVYAGATVAAAAAGLLAYAFMAKRKDVATDNFERV